MIIKVEGSSIKSTFDAENGFFTLAETTYIRAGGSQPIKWIVRAVSRNSEEGAIAGIVVVQGVKVLAA